VTYPSGSKDTERDRAIANDYLAGKTLPQIAGEWGISAARVRQLLDRIEVRRRDHEAPPPRRYPQPEPDARWCDLRVRHAQWTACISPFCKAKDQAA
jgi:transposase